MKNILLITYYWPPSGGASVQRPLKWVKYLRESGINPIVLTVDPAKASYGVYDESLLNEIPAGITVVTSDTSEPFNIYKKVSRREQIPMAGFSNDSNPGLLQKLARFIRGNFFIPDARVGWVRHAVKAGKELIQKHNIQLIVTTSPPHSLHLTGLRLKELTGIKWIADLNDPWTDIYYYKEMMHTPIAKSIDKRYERQVLETADKLITVSRDFRRLFLEKTNKISESNFTLIPNGFDKDDFHIQSSSPKDFFILGYTGTIAESYRVEVYFNAISKFVKQQPDCKLKLRFVGIVSEWLKNYIKQVGLGNYTEYIKPVPHKDSVTYVMTSTVLFLAIPCVENDKGICPGKLFEYLASGKPVICIGSPDGDTAGILQECGSGETFGRTEEEEGRLLSHIKKLYTQWLGNPDLDLKTNTEAVGHYERKYETCQLADLIHSITG